MSIKQIQTSGNESVNVQAQEITLGLSYADARQVALDVFEANFYRLASVAKEVASSRADELIDNYLSAMKNEGASGETLNELKNPDMQFALYTAEREYARSGDKDIGDLLVSLLVERTKITDRNLLQIVLNEAVGAAGKLTADQIDILSLVFIVKYTCRTSLFSTAEFLEYLDTFVLPFAVTPNGRPSAYQHLEFAGCASISLAHSTLENLFRVNYPGAFCAGFLRPIVNPLFGEAGPPEGLLVPSPHQPGRLQIPARDENEIRVLANQLGVDSNVTERILQLQQDSLLDFTAVRSFIVAARPSAGADLFSLWDESLIKNLQLTSVGMVIGHANMQRKIGQKFDLSIWI